VDLCLFPQDVFGGHQALDPFEVGAEELRDVMLLGRQFRAICGGLRRFFVFHAPHSCRLDGVSLTGTMSGWLAQLVQIGLSVRRIVES
jgi:hypothetical protein